MSTVHPGLVYTANDSGGSATVYVLDESDGRLVGQTSLTGVAAVDIEAMAIGDDGTLVVGDIGDNHAVRGHVDIYRLAQPGPGNESVTPRAVSLTYAGGPRDAESLLYDAQSGRVFVVSKLLGGAKVYRSPPHVFDRTHARLLPRASAPAIATDATFVDGHRYALIRSYFSAVVYRFPSWRKVDSFDLPLQKQGESVAALPGGRAVLIGSEGVRSKVLRFRLPEPRPDRAAQMASAAASSGRARPPSPVPASRGSRRASSRHRQHLRSIAGLVVGIALAGVALVLLTSVLVAPPPAAAGRRGVPLESTFLASRRWGRLSLTTRQRSPCFSRRAGSRVDLAKSRKSSWPSSPIWTMATSVNPASTNSPIASRIGSTSGPQGIDSATSSGRTNWLALSKRGGAGQLRVHLPTAAEPAKQAVRPFDRDVSVVVPGDRDLSDRAGRRRIDLRPLLDQLSLGLHCDQRIG